MSSASTDTSNQASTIPTVLTWPTGGYPSTYRRRTAGRFGADPCWRCSQRPGAGQPVWMNTYGDLYCDLCARQLAGRATQPPTAR